MFFAAIPFQRFVARSVGTTSAATSLYGGELRADSYSQRASSVEIVIKSPTGK